MSATTYHRRKRVIVAADKEPERYGHLVEKLDAVASAVSVEREFVEIEKGGDAALTKSIEKQAAKARLKTVTVKSNAACVKKVHELIDELEKEVSYPSMEVCMVEHVPLPVGGLMAARCFTGYPALRSWATSPLSAESSR